jgi:hypothetical protein
MSAYSTQKTPLERPAACGETESLCERPEGRHPNGFLSISVWWRAAVHGESTRAGGGPTLDAMAELAFAKDAPSAEASDNCEIRAG